MIVERLTFKDEYDNHQAHLDKIEYFNHQNKIVLRNCGIIDPLQHRRIYHPAIGYAALATILADVKPETVVETVCPVRSARTRRRADYQPA